nr:PhoH family protein [Halorhodospira abdelmalekii]
MDTSVLVHDPTALFRFKEHDVCLPAAVLEELDAAKEGLSEVARNARQTSRFLDAMLTGYAPDQLHAGVPIGAGGISNHDSGKDAGNGSSSAETNGHSSGGNSSSDTGTASPPGEPAGLLFFEMSSGGRGDSAILAAVDTLQRRLPGHEPILVSKDINLRIRAQVSGIAAEDYESDRVIDDIDLLPTGIDPIPAATWRQAEALAAGSFRLPLPPDAAWRRNQCLYRSDEGETHYEGIVTAIDRAAGYAELAPVRDFRSAATVWGVRARNREQNFALHLLMDPEIDLVTLLGSAGTGKTLLALAAGLSQTLDAPRYREVIATRATVAIGEEIGYLPGTEEEKMTPWMGALMDNLEVLAAPNGPGGAGSAGDWGRAASADLLHTRVRIRSLSFMRGRTFLEKFVILDEAQNLTAKQMKTLITRAGPGTKVVCLGNIGQIDTPYLTEATSGLTYVVDRLKGWPHSGHVTLQRGERSRLADYASAVL